MLTCHKLRLAVVSTAILGVFSGASAQFISSQAQLSLILGGNQVTENFEGNGLLGSGQIYQGGNPVLNSTSTFGGYGPGLVQAGVDYSANELWWNDNGYFGLNTRTLADSSGWRGDAITITYTTFVDAMGFDMQGYSGFSMQGIVTVYDLSNNIVTANSVNGGFFGWQNVGGISRVVVDANVSNSYIMLDNHGYGQAVPEPMTMLALAGGLALVARRRK